MAAGTDVAYAARVLARGGLVAFPTETVYGLGVDATSATAVARLYAVKRRPPDHPVIVHLAPEARLDDWAADVPEVARRLAVALWPGPLTLILRRDARIAAAVTGHTETVGLRIPEHPVAQALLRAFGGPVAAPSANRFGAVSPTTAAHVIADLAGDIDYVLDGGACGIGVESTIVDVSRGQPVLLRAGGTPRDALESITGPLRDADATSPAAPGTLASHYAPRAQVIAVEPTALVPAIAAAGAHAQRVAVLAARSVLRSIPSEGLICYPLPDDLADMARALYAALRDLDASHVDVVIAALPPAVGLGEAVGDRLRRAAGPRNT